MAPLRLVACSPVQLVCPPTAASEGSAEEQAEPAELCGAWALLGECGCDIAGGGGCGYRHGFASAAERARAQKARTRQVCLFAPARCPRDVDLNRWLQLSCLTPWDT